MTDGLTIHEAAGTTGWSPRMLRYVERVGLVEPRRSAAGYRLYGPAGLLRSREWPRLPDSYHGSGCTLASAVAAALARGLLLDEAVDRAQEFTWNSLDRALRTGRCKLTPNRFFACDSIRAHET